MFLPPASRYRLYGAKFKYTRLIGSLLFPEKDGGKRKNVAALEDAVKKDLGVDYALALIHARVGVYLAVKNSITPEKNEIILSPYTIVEVINMVIVAGGIPVFADVEPHTCNIDPRGIEPLITDKTAAIMVTHLHGLLCDMDFINALAKKHDVKVFEDAAQCYGAAKNGVKAGAFGDAGIFSFGMMKNINSFHGGMLVTNDKALYEKCKAEIADWPIVPVSNVFKRMLQGGFLTLATFPLQFKLFTFWLFRYGYLNDVDALMKWSRSENNPVRQTEMPEKYMYNTRDILAKFTLEQIPHVDANAKPRMKLAKLYHEGLKNSQQLDLPPLPEDGSHTYMSYPIVAEDRMSMMKYLLRHGRDVANQHMRNCADLDVFDEFRRDCPGAEKASKSIILLPTYTGYGMKEAQKTLEVTQRYLRDVESK